MFLSWLQISYQSIESSDPGINVPGPRRTVSKLRNETYHMFSGLHPGTTYLVSVRARTTKGFGQTALTEITTNISGETFRDFRFSCLWVYEDRVPTEFRFLSYEQYPKMLFRRWFLKRRSNVFLYPSFEELLIKYHMLPNYTNYLHFPPAEQLSHMRCLPLMK